MKLPQLKWLTVVATLAVALPLLFAGHWFWQRQTINQPLVDQLRALPGVSEVKLGRVRSGLEVKITADASIDFVLVAPKLRALVSETASGAKLIWDNQENAELTAARRALNLVLREAQLRHEYVVMEQRVAHLLRPRDLVYQLDVDEHYIYLKLEKDNQTWLEMLPVTQGGGGGQ